MKTCDKNIIKTLDLTEAMLRLANQGDTDREDVGCGILYGTLRDAAYKIQKLTEKEKDRHIQKGQWKSGAVNS